MGGLQEAIGENSEVAWRGVLFEGPVVTLCFSRVILGQRPGSSCGCVRFLQPPSSPFLEKPLTASASSWARLSRKTVARKSYLQRQRVVALHVLVIIP